MNILMTSACFVNLGMAESGVDDGLMAVKVRSMSGITQYKAARRRAAERRTNGSGWQFMVQRHPNFARMRLRQQNRLSGGRTEDARRAEALDSAPMHRGSLVRALV